MVTCPTYPEKFIWVTVIAQFVLLSIRYLLRLKRYEYDGKFILFLVAGVRHTYTVNGLGIIVVEKVIFIGIF